MIFFYCLLLYSIFSISFSQEEPIYNFFAFTSHKVFKLDSEVHSINNAPEIINEYSDLFESSLGKLPMVYHMKLDESVTPVICSARIIPMAMRDGMINEL